jgi:hypothetical protein
VNLTRRNTVTIVNETESGGNGTATEATATEATGAPSDAPVVKIRRRTVDRLLVAAGAVATVVLVIAGALLTWGATFATDYVDRELSSQNIFFPDAAALEEEGRTDLLGFAGEQVNTGDEAEAYASYIDGHLEGIADGATYADLGGPEREARAAVETATESGAGEDEIAALQAEADQIANQRNSLFKGETLRGLLLSTYAWSTVGRIAGIAAIAAFVAAAVMLVLVVLGIVHERRTRTT